MIEFLRALKRNAGKEKNPDNVSKKRMTAYNNDILDEEFPVGGIISSERNIEICNRFIADGLETFAKNNFNASKLDEITYDELCRVYNNVKWFVTKISSVYQKEAIEYKKVLRKNLLKKLRKMNLYVIYTNVTELPLALGESQILLFTNQSFASLHISGFNKNFGCLKIVEIQPGMFEKNFDEYYCSGYEKVIIDGVVTIEMSEIYNEKKRTEYGNLCIESRIRMIDYKQNLARLNCIAKNEQRELHLDERKQLNKLMSDTIASLLEDNLLLPAELKNGVPKKISVPLVSFADRRKYIGLFTDQYAINNYYNGDVSCIAFPELIKDQYNNTIEDDNISGILINPGREEFMLTKHVLSQVFGGTV